MRWFSEQKPIEIHNATQNIVTTRREKENILE